MLNLTLNIKEDWNCTNNTALGHDIQISGDMMILSILLLFMAVNIVLHRIGLHLFRCIIKKDDNNVQSILIVNLSVVEILLNLTSIIVNLVRFVPISPSLKNIVVAGVDTLIIIDHTLLSLPFYLLKMFIAIDKVIEVSLNIKYSLYLNVRRAFFVIVAMWSVAGIFCIVVVIGNFNLDVHYELYDRYFFLVFDFLSLIVLIACNSYLFFKFVGTQRRHPVCQETSHPAGILRIFVHSKFYLPTLLVISFITFVIIPDLLYEFLHANLGRAKDHQLGSIDWTIAFLYTFSFGIDACIYIFAKENLKRILKKKCRTIRRCESRNSSKNISFQCHRRVQKDDPGIALSSY